MIKCEKCGLCCLETEMLLSDDDISLILQSDSQLSKDTFIITTNDGFYQLKNIDGHCYFYNPENNSCRIYAYRPKGCRFYPLIYDLEDQQCIFDELCPRPREFYQNDQLIKKTCKEIKQFLKKELGIDDIK